ncbi:amino acid permease [Gammaproteobacteria bacterium]|nr:amino acid permease [Gammaproteobacteria bacterium]
MRKQIGVFTLVMINVMAIDNLRSLPFGAAFGWGLIPVYIVVLLGFFLPLAFVISELATTWPSRGGLYTWIAQAFGQRSAFVMVWLQWVYNVVWYPTALIFLAETFANLLGPAYLNNPFYISCFVILVFWAMTFANWFGMRLSSLISTIGALFGTLLPMVALIVFGGIWWWQHPIHLSAISWLPSGTSITGMLPCFLFVLFGLVGLELSSVHAQEVDQPHRSYPKALFISVLVIIVSLILSSLALVILVPSGQLSAMQGIVQAFSAFLDSFGLSYLLPIFVLLIMLSGLGGIATWIIGPTKSLLVAAEEGCLPRFFSQKNQHGVPTNILLIQAIAVSIITALLAFMPSIESTYQLLNALTSQLALLVYVVLFVAAYYLRLNLPGQVRPYKVPGGIYGMRICCLLGLLSCLLAIAFGFIPPESLNQFQTYAYTLSIAGGMLVMLALPYFFYRVD